MPNPIAKQRRGNGGVANLKPCKPGETHNRAGINGATKRRQMLEEIGRDVMAEMVQTSQGEMGSWAAVTRAMRAKACKGDVAAATWLRDTFVGKPVQTLAGDPDNPLFAGGIAEAVARANGELSKDDKAGG